MSVNNTASIKRFHRFLKSSPTLTERRFHSSFWEAAKMGSESLTVCVTGASGFIGSWLVMRLIQRGYTVRATVLDPGSIHPSTWFHLIL